MSDDDAFAASLGARMSVAFPLAEVEFDGENLVLYHRAPDGRFVHALVDFTCLDTGTVAVHARPDHVFSPHWEDVGDDRRVLVVDGTRFDGDGSGGDEFEDGLGNTVWCFDFSEDKDRIAALAVRLASLSAAYFE
jgi:hypothetical protein